MKKHLYLFLLLVVSKMAFGQILTSSNLPIVRITAASSIIDEPKVPATIEIFWDQKASTQSIKDTPFLKHKIGIELRGSSSQGWPKKPYGFELWDDKNEAVEKSIFGWTKESDFVLFASYNERSLMHNVLAQYIGRSMGILGSRTQYCELIVNNDYRGVYVFMEKVKQGNGRVDIADLKIEETSGDALTGGYIIKVDKTTGTRSDGWVSKFKNIDVSNNPYYQIEYPNPVTPKQRSFISSYVDSLEKALTGPNISDIKTGYRKFLDPVSFAQFMIVNEVSRNVDGYRISSYYHKDKNSKGGLLKAGPIWDFDLTFGNADYCNGWMTTGWSYKFNAVCPDDGLSVPFWWEKLLTDQHFVAVLSNEYTKARKSFLSTDKIVAYIDSTAGVLNEPAARNFQKWNRLGQNDWPIPRPVPTTYNGEIVELKNWLKARLEWLDTNMPKPVVFDPNAVLAIEPSGLSKISAYPNPFVDALFLNVEAETSERIELTALNTKGEMLASSYFDVQKGPNQIELPMAITETLNNLAIIQLKTKQKTHILRVLRQ